MPARRRGRQRKGERGGNAFDPENPHQKMISHFARQRGVVDECDDNDDGDDSISDLYEDVSESEPTSPTLAEKYLPSGGGEKTLRAVGRRWVAVEAEDAHRGLLVQLEMIRISS